MKIKSIPLTAILFISAVLLLNAEETPGEESYYPEAVPIEVPEEYQVFTENDDTVYVIRDMEFNIDGRTRYWALITNGEFKEGEKIRGKGNFDKYLARKTQLLLNQRVLEKASIDYVLGESEEDGAVPVTLHVNVKDTFNLVILPYPKYDSNDGLSIILKMRDYNFLGTMSPLRVDLGYQHEDGDNIFSFSIDSDIPFRAIGLNWSLNFDHNFSYTVGEPLYYQNVTGLSVEFPLQPVAVTVGFNQYLMINEENTDENINVYGLDDRYYGPYAGTELFASFKIPFGIEVGEFGELTYTPKVSGIINYPYGKMDEPRKPVAALSHSLGFGLISWIGNYRKGLSASMSNGFSWYFDRSDAPLRITFEGEALFHWPFSKYFGISTRLIFRQWWQWSDSAGESIPYYKAGDVVRGVIDEDIRADYMLSLNLDLPIRIIRFWPSEWFNNPKLHFFDFEMHFSPFMDIAALKGPYSKLKADPNEGTNFSFNDLLYTCGIEIIVFPGFFRSFYLRGSIGYDIGRIRSEGLSKKWGFFPQWDEIFIGVDHYY